MQSKLVMEGDNPSPEEHESADSEEQSGSTGNVRTYDCTFCKRGFSNAQALGGHMNIHRRDRAKMKQTTNLSQLPPDVSNEFVPLYSPHRTSYMSQLVHGDDDGGLFKWPRILPTQQNIHGDDIHEARPRQLPLFLETALRGEDWPSRSTRERKEEGGSASSPDAVELDLELRLGVKPPDKTMDRKGFV